MAPDSALGRLGREACDPIRLDELTHGCAASAFAQPVVAHVMKLAFRRGMQREYSSTPLESHYNEFTV